jgi:hypothetical protein
MPGVSIHVVDVARGVVAAGMEVELHAVDAGGKLKLIAKGRVGQNGLVNEPQLSQAFAAGSYVAVLHVAGFYRAQGVAWRRCRSSMSSASTSAFPIRRSTTTCRSNARRGVIRASAAARNPCRAFGARPLPARNRTRL